MTTCRSSITLLLALLGTLPGSAAAAQRQGDTVVVAPTPPQSAAPQTPVPAGTREHLVRVGDTMWGLATRYLGNGRRWPEIAELNSHRLIRGDVLPLGEIVLIPAVSATRLAAVVANGVADLPARSADTETADPRFQGRTIFFRDDRTEAPPLLRPPPAPVPERVPEPPRQPPPPDAAAFDRSASYWESLAAPWVDRRDGPIGAGTVLGSLDVPAVSMTEPATDLHLYDRVTLLPPASVDGEGASGAGRPTPMRAVAGDRYLAFVPGGFVDGGKRVLVPVGIVRVEQVSSAPRAPVEGVVVAKFGTLGVGAGLVRLPTVDELDAGGVHPSSAGRASGEAAASAGAGAARGASDGAQPARCGETPEGAPSIEARVTGIVSGAVLPTLQHLVLLDATTEQGVRRNDRVVLCADGDWTDALDAWVAEAVVLRATPHGSSALITRQRQPAIVQGMRGRIQRTLP